MNTKLNSIVAIALTGFIALSAFPLAARAAEETKRAAEPTKAEIAKRQATADKAAAKIQANESDLDRLVKAVKAKNEREAKAILAKNGFDAADAKVAMRDDTGGKKATAARKIKIVIKVTCCPPGVTITIIF